MSNADLMGLPVTDLVADDAHLYLWVTVPRMFDPDGPASIMRAWGFRYLTTLTWLKTGGAPGLGYYFRINTEHVLFGVRGHLAIPPAARESNVIKAGRRRHSEKPSAFMDLVERVSPGPYVELFARAPRLGWDSWGHGYEVAS